MQDQRAQTEWRSLLTADHIRRCDVDGRRLYAAVDIVAALADTRDPALCWSDLKRREPQLAKLVETAQPPRNAAQPADLDFISLEGVLRLIQSIPSLKAERIKT